MAGSDQNNSGPRSANARSKGDGNKGGRGGRRGRGGQNRNRDGQSKQQDAPQESGLSAKAAQKLPAKKTDDDAASDTSEEVCFICANPVQHYAIAPCNHTTCHICSLRVRALYKSKDCMHCRTASEYVIFTDDPDKKYQDYTDKDISSSDSNIGIRYANEDIVGDTLLLLRYNCPDPECEYAGLGLPDLHRHVKSTHAKKMCDLCTRNKKVFTHEHVLYEQKALENHMRKGDDKPGAVDQSGFKGHPKCGFCNERFYDDDKLFEHCRHKHERCFICDRQNSRQPHYFDNYDTLERHFQQDHFLCMSRTCLDQKFVVFESEVDLKAHQLEAHADSLSKDVRRDARIVNMSNFDYRQSYQPESSNRNRRGGRSGHGRDPNAEMPPVTTSHPLRRDEIAFQRQLALRTREESQPQASSSRTSSARNTPAPAAPRPLETVRNVDIASMSPQERLRLSQHQAVIERASNLLGNDAKKLDTFREYVSSFKSRRLTGPGFIDSTFTLFSDAPANSINTLVRELADLYEDPALSQELRSALQSWRSVNEDYPSLPGLAGMHGATTSSTGWANAVGGSSSSTAPGSQHSARLTRLKNSTRLGGPAPVSVPGSSTWVSTSSSSRPPPSSAFPALPSTKKSSASSIQSASRSTPAPRAISSVSGGEDAFPALPEAPKPQTTIFGYGRGAVRRDFGVPRNTGSVWSGPSSGQASGAQTPVEQEDGELTAGGRKKKGKKYTPIAL
ncbi:hypothetical protein TD95_005315 [Thielaviopsis punctulata]|uniref:RING-type E3 ubiquitin transferase n=1 Tax=Thielaviopsis punctulata TaxID=72032 RepID=A0A0F4Z8Q1_9PEZI|nr:hypothetical protein TD95_005315 [Thielaviopsis punctulata]